MPPTFLSPPSSCGYLRDRVWQLRYEVSPDIRAEGYMVRLRDGWRRFGPVLFRSECPSCQMCQSLRVVVGSFRPNQSQRRAWRRNAREVIVTIGSPSISPEKLALLDRFHQHGYESKGWPYAADPDLEMFVLNPFRTEEWCYHLGDRLVGVGYVDALPEGLSAIYFFHDPEEHHRSLGTFNILMMIEAAGRRGLPHVYLGYYVEGCRSMEYKARFRPNEVLHGNGMWTSFVK
jgi:arginyl-tRNA--protein-N-Asp/Glu arginylyltransferase